MNTTTMVNIPKLELILHHKWAESVVRNVKAIYWHKLQDGRIKIHMTVDFRGTEVSVSETSWSRKHNTLPQWLRLLYEKFVLEYKFVLQEMEHDFHQQLSDTPPSLDHTHLLYDETEEYQEAQRQSDLECSHLSREENTHIRIFRDGTCELFTYIKKEVKGADLTYLSSGLNPVLVNHVTKRTLSIFSTTHSSFCY